MVAETKTNNPTANKVFSIVLFIKIIIEMCDVI